MPVSQTRRAALTFFAGLVLPLSGCNLGDVLGPYLAPTAAQVLLLEVPLESLGAEWGQTLPQTGLSITVTLIRVGQSGTAFTEDDLLRGARVTLHHAMFKDGAELAFTESADMKGVYTLTAADVPAESWADTPLSYFPGTNYLIRVEHNGETYEISEVVPDRTSLTSPMFADYVAPGDGLRVTWEPEEAHSFVGAFDSSGEMVYSNLPTDPSGFYDFLTGAPSTAATLPASAFAPDEIYVVAAAAMRQSDFSGEDTLTYISDNLNPLGSFFLAGSAAVTAVTTLPLEQITVSMVGHGGEDVDDGASGTAGLDVEAYGTKLDLSGWFDGELSYTPMTDPMSLTVPGGSAFSLDADPQEPGRYTLSAENAAIARYVAGADYEVSVEDQARGVSRWLTAPVASGVSFEGLEGDAPWLEATLGQDLSLRWSPAVDRAEVQVYDADGQVVYTTSLSDGGEEGFTEVMIPASALAGEGLYSVAVSNLDRARSYTDSYAINTSLSAFLSGTTRIATVKVSAAAP